MARVCFVVDPAAAEVVAGLADYLRDCGWDTLIADRLYADADVIVAYSTSPLNDAAEEELLARLAGGTPILLAGPTLAAWHNADRLIEAAGVRPGRATPTHELRVRPGPAAGEVTARAVLPMLIIAEFPLVDKLADDVEVILTANFAYADHPVATERDRLATLALGTTPQTLADPAYHRLVHRLLRRLVGAPDGPPVRVGLLGYGAIGHEHNTAIQAVDGLTLAAVCDTSPARVELARSLAPDVAGYTDAADLLAADIDLVVVSTPPNSHADWALRCLAAGKSVVVEKPFCLTVDDADRVLASARERRLTVTVYQNRRWDPDYLALRRLVRSGAIGEVFHYESFVGAYAHPCNYWHSDEAVSGGAIYDWGSHYLDWILDLLPGPIDHVSAVAHKRVWHDVTNADQVRVTVRFASGAEAEFVHSDIAAAPKPKWYVLGTRGAVVGQWRSERILARGPTGLLLEEQLALTDAPAALTLHAPDGSTMTVAVPPAPPHPFHRELADHLLCGTPLSVTAAGARRTTAVLFAATASARQGGRPVAVEQ